jgi:hypothetical protein
MTPARPVWWCLSGIAAAGFENARGGPIVRSRRRPCVVRVVCARPACLGGTGPATRGRRCPSLRYPASVARLPLLGSARAIAVNIEIMRTFVRVRALATTHGDLAKRLGELEEKTEALALQHDSFSRNTRAQLKQVFEAIRELMTPPDPPKRPIGFVTPENRKEKG